MNKEANAYYEYEKENWNWIKFYYFMSTKKTDIHTWFIELSNTFTRFDSLITCEKRQKAIITIKIS